jgi:acyl-coenzyme A synthetase/AMP-(fatty) acid ligase
VTISSLLRTAGPLTVDGEPVPAAVLARLAGEAVREARNAMGERPGVALRPAAGDPLAVVVGLLAARELGVALALGSPQACAAPDAAAAVATAVRQAATAVAVAGEITVSRGTARVRSLPLIGGAARIPPEAAVVFWTSGSSGSPKAVLHSAGGLSYQGEATARRLAITDADTMLVPLPLWHAYGYSVLSVWERTGARLWVQTGFAPRRVMAALATGEPSALDGVPSGYAVLRRLARRDPRARAALARLRVRGCGGDVLPPSLAAGFLRDVGAELHDGYGLTEAGPNVALSAPGLTRPGTVGPPLAGTEVAVAAETGELQVRSPSVMLGYAGQAGPVTDDGWLGTGDSGAVDADGFVRVTGRLKEIVVVNGETVAPAVIEDALAAAGVRDAGVVGLPSALAKGDRVVAFVEFDAGRGGPAGVERVRTACRSVLAPAFRPDVVVEVPELPRLGSQKLDRAALRQWANRLGQRRK